MVKKSDPGLRPLNDRILLRREEAKEVTEGGLYIPESAQETPLRAEVLAVGPGRLTPDGKERAPCSVKVGDVVLLSRYGGNEVVVGGEVYLIVQEGEILAVCC